MFKQIILWILLDFVLQEGVLGAPTGNKERSSVEYNKNLGFFDELNQHNYALYMKEVLKELENDPSFNETIDMKNDTQAFEIYSQMLNKASSSTRSKLDEIKSREVARLNLFEEELRKMSGKDLGIGDDDDHNDLINTLIIQEKKHIHHHDTKAFNVNDLKALITKIRSDIHTADEIKERQYRRHEARKLRDRRRVLKGTKDPVLKSKIEQEIRDARRKHLTHKRVHEPGSRDQMKEIWKTQDNLEIDDFDAKTFFNMHDLNQDNHWDIKEIEAVVQLDIEKVYRDNDSYVDDEERSHEVMRMRKHMMEKMDINADYLVSLDEFMTYANSSEFVRDPEWKTMEEFEEPNFTDEDYKKFEEEIENLKKENTVKEAKMTEEHQKNPDIL